jgi:DNA-binding HxlR family transcriptional regulator
MTHHSNFCPEFHHAVELIGKRWSGTIVREMMAGAVRFTDLMHAIPISASGCSACGCVRWKRKGSWSGR